MAYWLRWNGDECCGECGDPCDPCAGVPCGIPPASPPPNTNTFTGTFSPFSSDPQLAFNFSFIDGIVFTGAYVAAGISITASDYAQLVADSPSGEVWLLVEDSCMFVGGWVQVTGGGTFQVTAAGPVSGDGSFCTCGSGCVIVALMAYSGPYSPGDEITPSTSLDGVQYCVQEWWDT